MHHFSRPSLLDVARLAGVSPATVSRVVNNTGQVSQPTEERVRAAMAQLGYEPAPIPPPAPTPKTIAVIITDILNPFFPEIVRGIEDEARSDGVGLLLYNTVEDPQYEQQVLRRIGERGVDGVIVCASRLPFDALINLRVQHRIPMVVIGRRVDHPGIACIVFDSEGAMYRATQHLLNLHHTRIAFLAGPAAQEASARRQRGVERALSEAGLSLPSGWRPASFPNIDGGFQAMSALLADADDRPTGIICYNDVIAFGALHAIRVHGLRVPEDISVVGFDNIAMTPHSNPPLTTVALPKQRMGELAMQMLRQMLDGQTLPGNGYTLVESPLIVRESTAPALGNAPHLVKEDERYDRPYLAR